MSRGSSRWRTGAGPVGEVEARGIEFEVEDGFLVDGAVGVEELAGDVAEDGGATRGDASFGDDDEEAGEELADVGAGGEFEEFGEEIGGEVGEVALVVLDGGAEGGDLVVAVAAKTKMGSGAVSTAALAVREPVMAAASG